MDCLTTMICICLHGVELDGAQHHYGVFSSNALSTLERIDGYLDEIFNELDQVGVLNESYIFIVSDHGFVNVSFEVHPGVLMGIRHYQIIVPFSCDFKLQYHSIVVWNVLLARAGLTHSSVGNYSWRAWPYNAGLLQSLSFLTYSQIQDMICSAHF